MSGSSWNKHQVSVLIEAYRKETCLHSLRNPNYHNKRLRADALGRVAAAVSAVRPNTGDKECATKFHNLRNSFNVENAKVKASLKSGVGAQDIYIPGLWYFDMLKFVEESYIPRKSRKSQQVASSKRQNHQDEDSQEVEDEDGTYFSEDGALNSVVGEGLFHIKSEMFSSYDSPSSPSMTASPITSAVTDTGTQQTARIIPSAKKPEEPSPLPKKPKIMCEELLTVPMNSASNLVPQSSPLPSTNSMFCPVDACMSFLGSILKQFQSEELRLEVMNTLVQTVITARTSDLVKAKR
ncbi:uncharacterized protein LOC124156110 [Ischnura elegans]|uniref:uncharacterized protein LOC124156110 n=1 Tax=Ischnura elegans TaxID=197161 RepID=UPI001ED885ED|nr:uncharacterized protein LOC124156110 [Ischnura elegans]